MANYRELKIIAKARLRTAEHLIDVYDWEGAAYAMGWALECALKSIICKILHLTTYPSRRGNKDDEHFLTHRFDRLLIVSGLNDLFGPQGSGFRAWSQFTKEYPGDWPAMRYDLGQLTQFDKSKVEKLYKCLIDVDSESDGIFTILIKKKRW